jgi:hypothetical protein
VRRPPPPPHRARARSPATRSHSRPLRQRRFASLATRNRYAALIGGDSSVEAPPALCAAAEAVFAARLPAPPRARQPRARSTQNASSQAAAPTTSLPVVACVLLFLVVGALALAVPAVSGHLEAVCVALSAAALTLIPWASAAAVAVVVHQHEVVVHIIDHIVHSSVVVLLCAALPPTFAASASIAFAACATRRDRSPTRPWHALAVGVALAAPAIAAFAAVARLDALTSICVAAAVVSTAAAASAISRVVVTLDAHLAVALPLASGIFIFNATPSAALRHSTAALVFEALLVSACVRACVRACARSRAH